MPAPGSLVYSPSILGDATVLGSGLHPLQVLQQQDYRQHVDAARTAKAKADLERSFTPINPSTVSGQLFTDQVQKSNNEAISKANDAYLRAVKGEITPNEAKALSAGYLTDADTFSKHTVEVQKSLDDFNANATKNFLDPAKAAAYASKLIRDPQTGEVLDLRTNRFDPTQLQQGLTNGELINANAKINDFVDKLAGKQESEYGKAATPGQKGYDQSFSSNIFESKNGKPVMEIGPNGKPRPRIADMAAFEQAVLRDPAMAAIYRNELQKGQAAPGEALMRVANGTLSDDQADTQLERLNAMTDTGTAASRNVLDGVFRDYGTNKTKFKETSPMAVPQRSKSGSLKAGDAVATPTAGFNQSTYSPGTTKTEVGFNSDLSKGLFNTKQVPDGKTITNNYPTLGHTFASQNDPFVKVIASTADMTTLGSDGENTKYNAGKTNSQVPVTATDRSLVLEINGKRWGLKDKPLDADAFKLLKDKVASLTPEEARKSVLAAVIHGGITDKGKTGGDGPGGKANVIGYKDADGRLLNDSETLAAQRRGDALTKVYDTTEKQIKVVLPATAQLDAQLARATPGYDPKKYTDQQQELIHLLTAKGGKVVDPYHTSGSAAPSSAGGNIYRKPTTNDDEWIGKIMDYERQHGAANGSGLANFGYNSANPKSRDEAVALFRKEYLPRVQHLPAGVRERVGDYLYNTGRKPEDLLLYAAGKISLGEMNGTTDLSAKWQQNKAAVEKAYSQPDFLQKLDKAKDDVYRSTKPVNGGTNPAYEATWRKRLGIFSNQSAAPASRGGGIYKTR